MKFYQIKITGILSLYGTISEKYSTVIYKDYESAYSHIENFREYCLSSLLEEDVLSEILDVDTIELILY